MTTDASTAYRDVTPSQVASLRHEVDRLTAELAKRDAVRPRWRLLDFGASFSAAYFSLVLAPSVLCNAGCLIAFGPAPFVLRWAAVNVVAVALWCLAFVRREVTP